MTALALPTPLVAMKSWLASAPDRRNLAVAFVAVALIAMLGASSLRSPAAAAPQFKISSEIRTALPNMSTGAHQALVITGTSAQERNALIPLAGGRLADMQGFTAIATDSAQYTTALKCMTQAIYYEAANEPVEGKRAVAQVVLNRLKHPAYPNSVCGVVYEGANAAVCQFSFTCDGSLLRAPMARQWSESRRIAQAALAGSVMPEVGSATHYHADYVLPRWAFTLGKVRKIGAHIFYRFPGSAGNSGVFADRWTGIERIPALDFDRLRRALEAEDQILPPEEQFVPGLTVVADVKDRHTDADVGGRLDTTRAWRLSIPDPQQLSADYRSAVSGQSEPGVPTSEAAVAGNPN